MHVIGNFVALRVGCGWLGRQCLVVRKFWIEADEQVVVVEVFQGVLKGRTPW
jgi:hypothetical protein